MPHFWVRGFVAMDLCGDCGPPGLCFLQGTRELLEQEVMHGYAWRDATVGRLPLSMFQFSAILHFAEHCPCSVAWCNR